MECEYSYQITFLMKLQLRVFFLSPVHLKIKLGSYIN